MNVVTLYPRPALLPKKEKEKRHLLSQFGEIFNTKGGNL
jgi:hypothetical protein